MLYVKQRGLDILGSSAQTLVVPVNTMGVMGKGLALEFKKRYPEMFLAYRQACTTDIFSRKGIFIWTEPDGKKILCLPTKKKWWNPSKLSWIDNALDVVARDYKEYGITSIAVPAIGCGNGGLHWEDVFPLIKKYLRDLDIDVYIYPPEKGNDYEQN